MEKEYNQLYYQKNKEIINEKRRENERIRKQDDKKLTKYLGTDDYSFN